MSGDSFFRGMNVAVMPYPNLGDTAVGFRLAWIFHQAGARVSFFSSMFMSAREYFPWLEISSCENRDIPSLSAQFDLVFVDVFWLLKSIDSSSSLNDFLKYSNVAYVTDKNRKHLPDFGDRAICVYGRHYSGADRPFCLDSQAGPSMVQWVDQYVHDVFGLNCPEPLCIKGVSGTTVSDKTRIAIFPVSSRSQKDYSLLIWVWLAKRLCKHGWKTDFICLPSEREKIQKDSKGVDVLCFSNIKELMDYLSSCAAVIANDSGGGHLGSLMGIKTITIIRRVEKNFVWRPGFFENHLLMPLMKIKLLGHYIWRPLVPIWRITSILGKPGK